MHILTTLLLVLLPLFIGYALPISKKIALKTELFIQYWVYIILFYIGIELSMVDGLIQQFVQSISKVIVLAVISIGSGLVGVCLFDVLNPWSKKHSAHSKKAHVSVVGSFVQVACVLLGVLVGSFALPNGFELPKHGVTFLLMVLIFGVGIGLKATGISLQQVFINKRGVLSAIVFTLSVWLGGLIYAYIYTDVSYWQGLALVSGMGWYSLSGILMTDAYGAVWGSVALCNDLMREFFALMFIPIVMKKYPSSAIAVGGATSLDFTLPTIQQSGGLSVIPTAISFGFIVNLIAPIAMVFFSSMG